MAQENIGVPDVAQAEQMFVRHSLIKYSPLSGRAQKRWLWEWNIGCVQNVFVLLATAILLWFSSPTLAWIMGTISLANVIVFLIIDYMACDHQLRLCLPKIYGDLAEAGITHPTALKLLVQSWKSDILLFNRTIPFLILAGTAVNLHCYDLATWSLISGTLWYIVNKVRRRVVRQHIRQHAENYLRKINTNPGHNRPVL